MLEVISDNVRREARGVVWFEPLEPLAGVARIVMTTRLGGISRPPYQSLNLGFHVGDVSERVRLNRLAVLRALDRKLLEPVVGDQVHGARVRAVGELHAGTRWETSERALEQTDALITATRCLPLVILVADCLPIALADPARRVVAAVHAGWRGLADGILEETLAGMEHTWGTVAADVAAWLGPAIGPCCYEVGPEVAERLPAGARSDSGGHWLDLRAEAEARLVSAGLLRENLTGLPLCTCCRDDLFFSHRRAVREGAPGTGRQGMLVWLEP